MFLHIWWIATLINLLDGVWENMFYRRMTDGRTMDAHPTISPADTVKQS